MIKIYGKCMYCSMLKAVLKTENLQFEEYDYDEVIKDIHGFLTQPMILVNGEPVYFTEMGETVKKIKGLL
jgi:glutaredoxin